eukprot:32725-Chlamydomonas_euryale.AAC.11
MTELGAAVSNHSECVNVEQFSEAVFLMQDLLHDAAAVHRMVVMLVQNPACHAVAPVFVEMISSPEPQVAHAAASIWQRMLSEKDHGDLILGLQNVCGRELFANAAKALTLCSAGMETRDGMLLQLLTGLLTAPELYKPGPLMGDYCGTAVSIMSALRPCLIGSSAATRVRALSCVATLCSSHAVPLLLTKHLVEAEICEYTAAFKQHCPCGVHVLVQLLQLAANPTIGDILLQAEILSLLLFVVHPENDVNVSLSDVADMLQVVGSLRCAFKQVLG